MSFAISQCINKCTLFSSTLWDNGNIFFLLKLNQYGGNGNDVFGQSPSKIFR